MPLFLWRMAVFAALPVIAALKGDADDTYLRKDNGCRVKHDLSAARQSIYDAIYLPVTFHSMIQLNSFILRDYILILQRSLLLLG